ncbi:uncharacterized protein LOC128919831 [Zeugodacus cucurbitae]|uniref:uncharacterized protein LOC128919831 n=1 Tax=Zeugodacus cucurbitae TaxID=28588 RepID=UPI0023D95445|nr:uncharacterized protein LOC128919831 [Zeugodacus cucurbitae]
MQLLYNFTALLSLMELSTIEQRYTEVFKDICTVIANDQQPYTFIYDSAETTPETLDNHDHPNVPFVLHTLNTPNPTAIISIDHLAPIKNYKELFHSSLISVVRLSLQIQADKKLLRALWQRLQRNRKSRLILLFDDISSEAYIKRILKYCAYQSAINVIGLQPIMAVEERSYWTLQIFPKQRTVRLHFPTNYGELFPRHMENMHGHALRVIENAWYPLIYNFTPKQGPPMLSGYVGRALLEYARYHNATISAPLVMRQRGFLFPESSDILGNNSADIGLLVPIQIRDSRLSYSMVVHFMDWCMMIPVEKPLPRYTFYYQTVDLIVVIVFCISLTLISIMLAILSYRNRRQQIELRFADIFITSVLQRLLGTPFQAQRHITTLHKFISIIISLAGVIISTGYSTYLQSFTVSAPVGTLMNTVDDVLKNGIQIALGTSNLYWVEQEKRFTEILQNYTFFSNFTDLLMLRDTLDTRYAFPVTDMWEIYHEQQKYFTKPLFRISNLCFGKNLPMTFIFQANSIYPPSINKFMGRLLEAGLIRFWLQHSFVELVAMDVIKLDDINKQVGIDICILVQMGAHHSPISK